MFLIIYAKIIDNKKLGLKMDGPYIGSECKTERLANEECKKLVTLNKDHILVKIIDLREVTYEQAKNVASIYFNRVFEQMQHSQELCEIPKRKRKKAYYYMKDYKKNEYDDDDDVYD